MATLSIAIPSRNEKFLDNTIKDVLLNATRDIEVFPVLDGYETEEIKDPRVHYIRIPLGDGSCHKRQGINMAVEQATGEYVMSLDAHCMVSKGFDEQLIKDHQPNWVQVPRRHRLDAENWCIQKQSDNRPPIDYEYLMFDKLVEEKRFQDFKWDKKTLVTLDKPIDDIMCMQASCWFMTKDWFKERGFMDLAYRGIGQESEEICFETWKNGGEVKVNKNTWYAHLHKGPKYGRMYHISKDSNLKSYGYAYNKWVLENKDFFISFIEKFNPPWPPNWKELIYG